MSIAPGPHNLITDVTGIRIGNAEDHRARTGVTVVLPDRAAAAAVDVRGGAPGTRETDALDPSLLVETVDAVVLSGGSAFGLEAASAVMNWLAAQDRGFPVAAARVPIVPAAILFDLLNGGDKAWGDAPPDLVGYRIGARAAKSPRERRSRCPGSPRSRRCRRGAGPRAWHRPWRNVPWAASRARRAPSCRCRRGRRQ